MGSNRSGECPARSEVVAFLPADGMSEQDMMPDLVLAALAVLTNLAIRGDLRARAWRELPRCMLPLDSPRPLLDLCAGRCCCCSGGC